MKPGNKSSIMKTSTTLKSLSLAMILLLSGFLLTGQSREKDEEADHQAAMEAEMKAKKEMLEQEQKMRQMEIMYSDQARAAESQARVASRARSSYRSSTGVNVEPFVVPVFEQSNQSQLTLRNTFNNSSESSKGEFDVGEDTRHFRIMISGKVSSGEIQIFISYPDGKAFKDLTINSAAEVTFSQSLTIKEGQEAKYIGAWKYQVNPKQAEGNYMLQISTH